MTDLRDQAEICIRPHTPGDIPRLLELLELSMVETYPDLKTFGRSALRYRVEVEFVQYYEMPDKA
ncbi:MAG: hypothetical protein KGR26_04735, partial [Cyanobacteria bacterium REEB65]|nr:hypothetical protein [Cyanobacteria bacterium REEB65]